MTEEKAQIQELIESNDELENYFRNTIIPQLYVDGDLKLRKFTPPAMLQFHLSSSDIGRPIGDIKDNLRFPTITENILEVIETNEILEKEIQTTDMRWYQMNIIPYVKIKDNRTEGVIITFVEITLRIKDLKAQEKLIADNAILLDTISHDIRNPLSNLVAAVNLFKSASPDDKEDFHTLLNIVDVSLMKMHKVIVELTDFRREEHEGSSQAELLNFGHILEDVRLTLSDNFNTAQASIKSRIEVSEISFSRRKLRTVLYNLVNNALKFTSPERRPEIMVATYAEKEWTVISVRDNGIGIAGDEIDGIFTKYRRLNADVEGSGIGLYLVKEIVTHAGGKATAESTPGEGSEFKIYLRTDQIQRGTQSFQHLYS